MTLGSLFAGIGGFELAATWAGIEPIWSNEIDSFCCKVLRKNFNHEIIKKDIRKIGKHNLKPVDIISAGVPCQPASIAGKRKGTDDDRWLWDEAIRVVSELKPSYVVCENPTGILSLENGNAFEGILFALENEGYEIELFNIPAGGIGTWHRRERIWVVAYTKRGIRIRGNDRRILLQNNGIKKTRKNQKIRSKNRKLSQVGRKNNTIFNKQPSPSEIFRVDDGVSNGMERSKVLGNAIVPQVAYELFKAIKLST